MRTNDTAHKRIYTLLSCLQKTGILPYTMIIAFSVTAESCGRALWEESPAAVPIGESFEVRSAITVDTGTADVFIFDEDERLESYQRLEISGGQVTTFSTNGRKIMAAVLNYPGEKYEWAGINTVGNIMGMSSDLRKDNPQRPIMSAISNLDSGLDRNLILTAKPLLSEIRLNSIRCDFRGKPYSNLMLTDIQVYLTNVNSSCVVFKDRDYIPTDILNSCRLCMTDVESMDHPEMIYNKLDGPVGNNNMKLGLSLWCYPNDIEGENGGSRFTRLVIEGKIGSVTWFYPININREDNGTGISRFCTYSYDITIYGTGVTDPEIPANSNMVSFECNAKPYDEMEEQEMHF